MLAKVSFLCMTAVVFAGDAFFRPGFSRGGLQGPGYSAAGAFGNSYAPQPYSFGYDNVDEFGTKLFHKEEGDANNRKTGSYGYTDANGLYRRVSYVADENGFRATIDTNEPGTQAGSSADAVFNANPVASGLGLRTTGVSPAPGAYNGGYGYGNPGYSNYGLGSNDRGNFGLAGAYGGYGGAAGNSRYGHHGYRKKSA